MQNKIFRILFLVLLFVLQVIISEYLNLGPFVYICLVPIIILNIPLSTRTWILLLKAFAIGLLLDMFSNGVLGLNSAAAVLLAACRKPIYKFTARRDRQDKTEIPNAGNIGANKYLEYLAACTALYILTYTLIDGAGINPFWLILAKFLASTAVNVLVALLINRAIPERS